MLLLLTMVVMLLVMVMAGDRRDPVPHVGRDADSEGSGDVRNDGGDL